MPTSLQLWQRLSEKEQYRARIFSVWKGRFRSPHDQRERDYDLVRAPHWINVIPLTREGKVVLIRQYRPGTHEICVEVPGGMVDPGEEPLEAARRELTEETGYRAERIEPLGVVAPNPAFQNNLTYSYLAQNAYPAESQHPDEDEHIETFEAPLADIPEMIRKGEIRHALVVCAFAHLALAGGLELSARRP
ncbi:MAG: NUDIX hydrolase [Myxococcales bacterium]|nr:NUDIX hydrolase [Myxococcales bacterium]